MTLTFATIFAPHSDLILNYSEISDYPINAISTLESAGSGNISFCHNNKYLDALTQTRAGYIIIPPKFQNNLPNGAKPILSHNPYLCLALIMQALNPKPVVQEHYIDSRAMVDASAQITAPCNIASGVYIGKNCIIGAGCIIRPNTVIEDGVIIGKNNIIEALVTISHAEVGDNNVIQSGARIGNRGFGFATAPNGSLKGHWDIAQNGIVKIGNFVEIGANACIDRAQSGATIISDHARIDDLVMIGHGAEIGFGSIIVAQAGISGSTKLGQFVTIAAQAGVAGHLKLGDGSMVAAKSGAMQDLNSGEKVGGTPAINLRTYLKNAALLKRGLF